MANPTIGLWPRWLRLTIVEAAVAAIISGGWLSYGYFAKPVVLTVAVGAIDGEALSLIYAVAARLTTSKPTFD